MEFTKPIPYAEAINKLGQRSVIGSKLSSAQWRDVPVGLRERAFFSARVESAQFLQRAQDGIGEFVSMAKETVETERGPEEALSTGGRSDFVKQMTEFLKGEGIERTTGEITDIAGERRLNLIFDTQVRQAHDYGYAKQGWDPDVLDAYPAQRFIRVAPVEEPRDWHIQFENEVRLKSDVGFWSSINQDFGVPWGPWGWGCQHDVEDVDRAEAEALGLIEPGAPVLSPEAGFNERLEASTKHLDPDIAQYLRESLGSSVEFEGESVKWTKTAPSSPRPEPAAETTEPDVPETTIPEPTTREMLHEVEQIRRENAELENQLTPIRRQLAEATREFRRLQSMATNADVRAQKNRLMEQIRSMTADTVRMERRIKPAPSSPRPEPAAVTAEPDVPETTIPEPTTREMLNEVEQIRRESLGSSVEFEGDSVKWAPTSNPTSLELAIADEKSGTGPLSGSERVELNELEIALQERGRLGVLNQTRLEHLRSRVNG